MSGERSTKKPARDVLTLVRPTHAVQLIYSTYGESSDCDDFCIKYHALDDERFAKQLQALIRSKAKRKGHWYACHLPRSLRIFAGVEVRERSDESEDDDDDDDDGADMQEGSWVLQDQPPEGWVVCHVVYVQDYCEPF
jgi:hypothetical protein